MNNSIPKLIDCDRAADLIDAYWQGAGEQHDQMRKLAISYRDGHTQGVWAHAFRECRETTERFTRRDLQERLTKPLALCEDTIRSHFAAGNLKDLPGILAVADILRDVAEALTKPTIHA